MWLSATCLVESRWAHNQSATAAQDFGTVLDLLFLGIVLIVRIISYKYYTLIHEKIVTYKTLPIRDFNVCCTFSMTKSAKIPI